MMCRDVVGASRQKAIRSEGGVAQRKAQARTGEQGTTGSMVRASPRQAWLETDIKTLMSSSIS